MSDKSNAPLFSSIAKLVADKAGINVEEVTWDLSIERDIGLTGDDAIELLLDYSEKYNVDVSNFMAADYFDGEGSTGDFISYLLVWLFNGTVAEKKKHLTPRHLVKGVIAGKLDEEVINSAQ